MTIESHKEPRLYMNADLAAGHKVALNNDQAHYLLHVMRVQDGTPIRLFNGHDGEWLGTVILTGTGKKQVFGLCVQSQLKPQYNEPDLRLICAPIKRAHFEFMVMKATELGVSHIQPMLTARTQIRDVNIDRCRAIAIEAAEQSERLTVPEIMSPLTLQKIVGNWDEACLPIICAEFGNAEPIAEAFTELRCLPSPSTAIFTGPEGGFLAEELELLMTLPKAVSIRLGSRILRADTSALAAITCWQAMCGDWDNEKK